MVRAIVILCLAVFTLVVGTGIVAPLLAPYATALGATGIAVGMLYSGFYVVRLLVGVPIGRLADRKGPKAVLTYSLILYPFIATAYWLAWGVPSLLGARLLHGLASAMMLPMAMAYMGEISPVGEEGRYMGIYNTVLFLANGAGPLVGGLVAQTWGTKNAFLCLFGLAIISLALTFFALPSSSATRTRATGKPEPAAAVQASVTPWRHPGLLALAAVNVVGAVLSIFLVSFFTLFAQSRGLDTASIGLLISLNNVLIGATQLPLGWLADRYDKYKLILLAAAGTSALLFLFPSAGSFWKIAALMAAAGLTSALSLSASSTLSAVLGRTAGMGSAMGFLGSATSAGMVLGPLASGFLVDRFSIEATFYFSGAMWALGGLAFAGLWAVHARRSTGQKVREDLAQ